MRDTAVLGDLGRSILSKMVGKLVVFPKFFRALGSIAGLFPQGKLLFVCISTFSFSLFTFELGGNSVWRECYGTEKKTFEHMLTFPKDRYKDFADKVRKLRETCEEEIDYDHGFDSILEEVYAKPELIEEIMTNNHTTEQIFDVLTIIAPRYMSLVDQYYNLETAERIDKNFKKWKSDPRYWTDPLSTPLPNVTNLKIYCSEFLTRY